MSVEPTRKLQFLPKSEAATERMLRLILAPIQPKQNPPNPPPSADKVNLAVAPVNKISLAPPSSPAKITVVPSSQAPSSSKKISWAPPPAKKIRVSPPNPSKNIASVNKSNTEQQQLSQGWIDMSSKDKEKPSTSSSSSNNNNKVIPGTLTFQPWVPSNLTQTRKKNSKNDAPPPNKSSNQMGRSKRLSGGTLNSKSTSKRLPGGFFIPASQQDLLSQEDGGDGIENDKPAQEAQDQLESNSKEDDNMEEEDDKMQKEEDEDKKEKHKVRPCYVRLQRLNYEAF